MAFRLGKIGSSDDWGEESSDIVAEINITPLTDIFLVLLIIFMVTSSVMTNSGVDVNLPQASQAASESQPDGVIVTLLPDGGMRLDTLSIKPGDYDGLKTALTRVFANTKSRLVVLEGDRQAFLGNAIQVMDAAKQAGAEKFAIATTAEKK